MKSEKSKSYWWNEEIEANNREKTEVSQIFDKNTKIIVSQTAITK